MAKPRNGKQQRKSAKPGELTNGAGVKICGSLRSDGSGRYCQSTVIMPNGRCEKHGGKSHPPGPGHPTYVHGRGSKFFDRLPERLRAGYEASVSDPDIVSLRAELGIIDARVGELLDRLTPDSLEAVSAKLDEIGAAVEAGNLRETEKLISDGRALIQALTSETATWREIRRTVEVRRRLSEQERRLLEHRHAVVELTELRAIASYFLQSVREHVLALDGGRGAVAGIALDVQKLLLPPGNPPEA